MDINAEIKKTAEAMAKALDFVLRDFETIHTGKASPSMVEGVMVDVYGSSMRMKDVAAITTPDSNLIRIQPWDRGILKEIEKAILAANIGITRPLPHSRPFRRTPRRTCKSLPRHGRTRQSAHPQHPQRRNGRP